MLHATRRPAGRAPALALLLALLVVATGAQPGHAATTTHHWDDAFSSAVDAAVDGQVLAIAPEPGGTYLVGGSLTVAGTTPPASFWGRNGLVRLHADGTLDTAFAATIGQHLEARVTAIAVDEETGDITVGGNFSSPSDVLARFHADGTPDTAFNSAVDRVLDGAVSDLHVDSRTGAITVGGWFSAPSRSLARFHADGTLDTAFNAAVAGTLDAPVRSIAVNEATGTVTAGGDFISPARALARFHADGTPDTAFNTAVGDTLGPPSPGTAVYSVALDPRTGATTVGGVAFARQSDLARFHLDGTPDTAFDAAVGATLDRQVLHLALEPATGALLVGGLFREPSRALARFRADGTPDPALSTSIGRSLTDDVFAVASGPDGAVLVGGGSVLGGSPSARLVPRTVTVTGVGDQVHPVGRPISPVRATGTVTPAADGPVTFGAEGLPEGLVLDPVTGEISGTPTTERTATVTLSATAGGATDTTTSTWTITATSAEAPTLDGAPPAGVVGAAYDHVLTVTGDPAPAVTVTDGALPDGLALTPDGRITGTPTAAGDYPVTLTAANGTAPDATLTATITVTEPTLTDTPAPEDPAAPSTSATEPAAGNDHPDPASGVLATTGAGVLTLALTAAAAVGAGVLLLRRRARHVS